MALLTLLSCATIPRTPQASLESLAATPNAYLAGPVAGVSPPFILNREDFVWAIAPSPDSKRVAFVRLGPQSYHLAVWTLAEPPVKVSEAVINPLEFDVESLAWHPDGTTVAAVSKDASVRFFDALTGKLLAGYLSDEPLVSVAFHPDGKSVALGSVRGLITVLDYPSLQFGAERRLHTDEVRALTFASGGRLFSGSWDRSIGVLEVSRAVPPSDSARVHVERKAGYLRLRGVIGHRASALFAVDARMPAAVVLGSAFAAAAGIDASLSTETVSLPSSFGSTQARLVRNQKLTLKGLDASSDVAVCDSCLPPEVQGVLGQAFLDRFTLTVDESTSEAVLTAKQLVPASSTELPQLKLVAQHRFDASVNDVTVDRSGAVLGVAFSAEKSQRTREVYEQEKKKQTPPPNAWNVSARVDTATGQVLEKREGHAGVVATAAISADGITLASGGWDRTIRLAVREVLRLGWAARQVRFSADGRWLVVAAWTPQNPLGDHQSDPSAVVFEVRYATPTVKTP